MKHLLIMVMIISLLMAAVGCSNGLVSSKDDLSGEEIPTQETTQETNSGQIEPENINSDDTDGQGQNEPETLEADKPEENQSETETPEVIPPTVEQPEEVPPVAPPTVEPPELEPSEVEQPEVEPPIVEPPVEPPEVEPPEVEPPEVEPPVVIQPMIALLEINELRTDYSTILKKAEYVEFKVKRSGNLNGISLHIMYNAKNPFVYNFPNISVNSGEYITLHLRILDNNCKDELGDNLALSGGIDSCPTARDLWVSGSNKYLQQTDIVFIKEASGKIMDAIIMNEKPGATWDKSVSHFAQVAEYLFNEGAWETADGEKPTPFDAVSTKDMGTGTNKSVCRYEWRQNHFNNTDWYINYTSPTPGLPNK